MEQSNFKNMVILKNLPSNLVEEAIVILKPNKKVRQLEQIENSKIQNKKAKKYSENNYIVKEAELIISKYISILEEKRQQKHIYNKKKDKKYKMVKKYSYIASLIILIESIALLIK